MVPVKWIAFFKLIYKKLVRCIIFRFIILSHYIIPFLKAFSFCSPLILSYFPRSSVSSSRSVRMSQSKLSSTSLYTLFPLVAQYPVPVSRGCSPSRGARVKAPRGWLRLLRARETVRLTSDMPRLRAKAAM